MFSCVLIFVLVNTSGANRYEAAEAIQHAIFGEDTLDSEVPDPAEQVLENTEELSTEQQAADAPAGSTQSAEAAPTDSDQASPTEGATAAADSETQSHTAHAQSQTRISAAHAQSQTATGHSHSQATEMHTTEATTSPAAQHMAYIQMTAGQHRHTGSGRGRWQHVAHTQTGAGGGQYLVYRPHHTQPPHTTTPPPQGTKSKFAGKSYSFQQLSAMQANSAPGQTGNFYKPREYEQIPRVQPCQAVKCHLSVVVVMDSSGSVGYQDYQKELSFVKTLLEILSVKAQDSKLRVCTGLVSYSTDVHVEVDPCCENSICRIVDRFRARRLAYRDGSTNTHGALKVARQMLQAAASYKKVALLITDGKSNTGGSPVPFAKRMRDQDGIQIVALGVTDDVNRAELMGVSGMDRVTKIDVFDEFHELASLLLQANKVASQYELETSFDAMCYRDKSVYKDQCARVITEEQKSQCVMGEWSDCIRKGAKCSQTRVCKLNGIVILREDQACECPPCRAGTYLDTADQHCRQCKADTYSEPGATSCITCPGGTFSDPGSGSADKCVNELDIVDADGNSVPADKEEHGGLLLYKGGTVCDDYFNDNAANAICRAMGRRFGAAQWKHGMFFHNLQSSKRIKLDDVVCHSDVWAECDFSTRMNCSHDEDVHIVCRGKKEPKPTEGKTKPTEGKTEPPSDPTGPFTYSRPVRVSA